MVISPAPWCEPCQASQTPFLRPRPGISPPGVPMAPRNSIAPGPGGPFRPRPYWLILPPPIHGPPPGGVVNQRRGRMVVNIPGAGCMGPGGYCRVYPMGRVDISACQGAGSCAGGRPHGGGACAVYRGRRGGQDGGPFPCPERGAAVRFNPARTRIVRTHSGGCQGGYGIARYSVIF